MVGSGLAAFLIYLVKNELGNLLVSIAFGLVSTMGFNALDCMASELNESPSSYLCFELFVI